VKSKGRILYPIMAILGLSVWFGISTLTQKPEAWDSPYYFTLGLPLLMFFSAISAFIEPRHAWRWGITAIIVQPIALSFTNASANFNLLPLSLFALVILMIPCILAAYIGVGIRRLFFSSK